MKRMYVVLGLISLFLFWTFSSLGQKKSPDPQMDSLEERLQAREEMHRRMMDKILHGRGPDQDLFKDIEQFFQDSLADSLKGFEEEDYSSFFGDTNAFTSEWIDSESSRTLVITPKNKDVNLDINVDKNLVSIKGKSEIKTSSSSRISHFNRTFPVPSGCDGSKVEMSQKDGKILIKFPCKVIMKSKNRPPVEPSLRPIEPSLRPIEPSGEEVEI